MGFASPPHFVILCEYHRSKFRSTVQGFVLFCFVLGTRAVSKTFLLRVSVRYLPAVHPTFFEDAVSSARGCV